MNKVKNFLYAREQLGIVFTLFLILIITLPWIIWVIVSGDAISKDEVDRYSKFASWFTAIGVICSIINSVIVIYLMFFISKREQSANILLQVADMRNEILNIEKILIVEIDHFNEKRFDTSEQLSANRSHLGGFHIYGYDEVYKDEISNLQYIIDKLEKFYKEFREIKDDCYITSNIKLEEYQNRFHKISSLKESLILATPSSAYKKIFIQENRCESDPEYIIGLAKEKAVECIDSLFQILNKT